MPRPKLSDFLKRAKADVDELTGIDRTLVDPMLVEADAMRSFVEQLRLMVQEDGPMIEKEVGTVNNRHMEMVVNPALDAYSKNVAQMGNLFKKLSSLCKSAERPEEEEEDAFEAFNA